MSRERSMGEARLTLANLRQQARPEVVLPPMILLGVVFIVAYVFRPTIATPADRSDYETFFEAAATVLGTILIAIVLQANLFSGPGMRRILIYGLLYIAVAEAAALIALLPGGSAHFKGVLFALTVSAGIGALLAVVYIGVWLLEEPGPELELQTDGSAVIDDPGADPPAPPAWMPEPPQRDRDTERIAHRQRIRAERQRRAGHIEVVLHPEAVADLEQMGQRERTLVLAITERALGNARAAQRRSVPVDEEWSELRAGGLRVVYRPLSEQEAAAQGRDGGAFVRRILASDAARQWLSRRSARAPDSERGADRR